MAFEQAEMKKIWSDVNDAAAARTDFEGEEEPEWAALSWRARMDFLMVSKRK